ncbi:response regulator [Micromonospora sp. B11E3]|uniref:response regulator n=1 Tax=Micromonospora sp. B11E3 TaxID=3153562 RepID=UPI00325E368C
MVERSAVRRGATVPNPAGPVTDPGGRQLLAGLTAALPEHVVPLARPAREIAPAAEGYATELAGRKVLVVDDDARNVFALTNILELHGMDVVYAENGRQGIETLMRHDDIDLVLMDVMMPEMDGYAATAAIRAMPRYADLPIIAVTAKAIHGDREKSITSGASDYVTKPVDRLRHQAGGRGGPADLHPPLARLLTGTPTSTYGRSAGRPASSAVVSRDRAGATRAPRSRAPAGPSRARRHRSPSRGRRRGRRGPGRAARHRAGTTTPPPR